MHASFSQPSAPDRMSTSRYAIASPEGLSLPSGYSHVTVTSAPLVHIAGQVATDAEGHTVGVGDFSRQAAQAFANLAVALASAGSGANLLASLNIYVGSTVPRSELASLRSVLTQHLSSEPPAITLIYVAGLLDPEWLIEVQAVAILPEEHTRNERNILEPGA